MIEIQLERSALAPGEPVKGRILWTREAVPERLELRLLWYTEGRGDQDVGVARRVPIGAASASGSSPFQLVAPSGPYSCSGRLVSVCWALEAVAQPGDDVARAELVLAPDGREVTLGARGEGQGGDARA